MRPSAAGNNRRKRPAAPPSSIYAPGFFTSDLAPHSNWPHPQWKPAILTPAEMRAQQRSKTGHSNAVVGVETGAITCRVVLPGTPKASAEVIAKLRAWRPTK